MTQKLILPLLAALLASAPSANAADVTWDITPGKIVAGDSSVTGGSGTWNTTNGNWTTDAGVNNVAWVNGNNDTALFGGTAGTVTLGNNITLGGLNFTAADYIINDDAAGSGPYTLTLNGPATINTASGNTRIEAAITGSSGLVKTGGGTLFLKGANTYTGDTVISGGVLRIGENNRTTNAVLGGGSYAGNISIASGAELYFQTNATQTLTGVISGAGILRKSSSGTLILGNQHTYTGKTYLLATNDPNGRQSNGNAVISSFNSINETETGAVLTSSSLGAPTNHVDGQIEFGTSVQASSSMQYVGSGETTNRILRLNFNSSGQLTFDNDGTGLLKFTNQMKSNASNQSGKFVLRGTGDGEIVQGLPALGTGGLQKLDSGTWTIGGTSSINVLAVDGGTLVNGGQFNVTTSVTVSNGATLTAGYMTAASMSLGGTSSLNMELGGTTLGTEYDNITIAALGAMAYGGNLSIADTGGFDMDLASQVYDLFALNGVTATGNFASVTVNGISLSNSGGLWTGANGGTTYSFSQASGDFTVTAVPEPSAAILGSLGLLCLLRRRRR